MSTFTADENVGVNTSEHTTRTVTEQVSKADLSNCSVVSVNHDEITNINIDTPPNPNNLIMVVNAQFDFVDCSNDELTSSSNQDVILQFSCDEAEIMIPSVAMNNSDQDTNLSPALLHLLPVQE